MKNVNTFCMHAAYQVFIVKWLTDNVWYFQKNCTVF